jgi:hypothetical protein
MDPAFSWKREIWPMQWRIAISWISGYFISQLFVPILFYYQTAEIAGKMGMTLSLANMLPVIGQAWLNAKAPFLGRLLAEKKTDEFEELFFKVLFQSTAVVVLGAVVLVVATILFQSSSIFQRLLPSSQVAMLALSAIVTHGVNCLAQYLRSFKREPMMEVSVIGAILIASSGWYCGKHFSSLGICVSALSVNLFFGLPTALWVWVKYKSQWLRALA